MPNAGQNEKTLPGGRRGRVCDAKHLCRCLPHDRRVIPPRPPPRAWPAAAETWRGGFHQLRYRQGLHGIDLRWFERSDAWKARVILDCSAAVKRPPRVGWPPDPATTANRAVRPPERVQLGNPASNFTDSGHSFGSDHGPGDDIILAEKKPRCFRAALLGRLWCQSALHRV